MKIKQYTTNQFLLEDGNKSLFQSYDSVIAIKETGKPTILDRDKWDYSKTTGKYRNLFLGETKKETEAKIKSGEYLLQNLN
jgi:hypothetical protein